MESNLSAPKLIAKNALERSNTQPASHKFLFPLRLALTFFGRSYERLSIVMNLLLSFNVYHEQYISEWEKGSRSRNELSVLLFKINRSRRKHCDEKSLKNSMKASAIIVHKSTTTSKIFASESDKTCSTAKTVCSRRTHFSSIVNCRRACI